MRGGLGDFEKEIIDSICDYCLFGISIFTQKNRNT